MRYKSLMLVLGVSVVAGCSVGPDYKPPQSWSPEHWDMEARNAAGPHSRTVEDRPDPQWWDIFHDPQLSALERRVAKQNLDVQIATARLLQSRAMQRIAGADRYPALAAAGRYTRQKYSTKMIRHGLNKMAHTGSSAADDALHYAGSNLDIPDMNQWQDELDASWEVDLWGRVRRQYESAEAQTRAAAEVRRAVLIARLAEVARDYLLLRGLQTQLHILQDNEKTARASRDLTRQRYRGGVATELDVQSSQAQLDDISAQIPPLQQQIDQQINALGLLLGEPPKALAAELQQARPVPLIPPRVPVGVPSELARRRPDIREAEARLHAATAEVGQAEADFYPRITIDAGFGFQSLSFGDLGFWSSRVWNVGPRIQLPIFEGGRLRGQLELRKSQHKEAALSYRQVVLTAWKEVDDALTAYRDEQLRYDRLRKSVAANSRALDLAREQYRHGTQTFLAVLDSQRRLLNAQKNLADSSTQMATNLVQLYTALGGGWEKSFPDSPVASAAR